MVQTILTVEKNEKIAKDVFEMALSGDASTAAAPGQFLNFKIDGFFLRRPISVCDRTDRGVTVIYKTVGDGTRALASLAPGAKIDTLCGLGNGFSTDRSGASPLLVGGGVGTPPLFFLCRELLAQGKKPAVIIGFNSSCEIILEDRFKSLGVPVTVTTADGSRGVRGFVTDALGGADYTYVYACGPIPMLRALDGAIATGGEFSFEERMGCGFGACMGCSVMTRSGPVRVCRDGPVIKREDVIW